MRTVLSNIDREFTPSEAAAVTGVSADLQRDWRRRGLLSENSSGRWTRFSLTEIIRMSVMKTFSDAGYSVSYVAEFADMAILPTLSMIYRIPGAVAFEGDEISDKLRRLHIDDAVMGNRGRYLVMTKDVTTGQPAINRWEALEGIDEFLSENFAAHFTALDCLRLADLIAVRAGLPLIRVEVERVDSSTPLPP